jgi:NADH-quinone oxidoreductase subunit A
MTHPYLPVLLALALAVIFPLGLLAATSLLGPRVRLDTKGRPYECGVPPVGSARDRVPVKFYRLAILFLIFDLEAALLFPWAVLFRPMLPEWGLAFLLGELLLFLGILGVGYAYAWRKGALEWD